MFVKYKHKHITKQIKLGAIIVFPIVEVFCSKLQFNRVNLNELINVCTIMKKNRRQHGLYQLYGDAITIIENFYEKKKKTNIL